MKIYISGPVTGHDDYMEKFRHIETFIAKIGHQPINPTAVNAMLPKNTTWHEYMKMSFVMLDMADAIYQLPDWESSRGANQEYGYAMAKGLPVFDGKTQLCKICEKV